MRSLLVRLAFLVVRIVFAERMRQAFAERDRDEAASVRAGKLIFAAGLFADWVVASDVLWLLTGRTPAWSARRLRL